MSFKYLGDSNQLAFQFESGAYGTTSGARQWIGLVQDHTPSEAVGAEPVRYQGGFTRNVGLFTDGQLEYGGAFTFYPQDWKFLGFAMGSVDSTGTGSVLIREADSDERNYAIPSSSLSSFTLEDAKKTPSTSGNFIRTFNGCMVDSLSLTLSEGEIASVEVNYKAKNAVLTSGTVTAVTARTTKPYMWSDVQVYLPSGTAITNCTEYSFTINNNLESRYPLNGSRTVEEQIPLNRDYEVSATFLMDTANAHALYESYYVAGSSFNSLVDINAVAGSAAIIMSGCRITDMEVPSPVEGINEQTCTIVPSSVSVNVYDSIGSYTCEQI